MKKLLTLTIALSVIGLCACGTEVPEGSNETVAATKAVNNPSDKGSDGKTDKGQNRKTEGDTDNDGPDCAVGSGKFGADCKPCNCQHGTCNDGKDGDGSCSCEGNWSGDNCDICSGNFWGSNCDQCKSGFYGQNCAACTCVNGTCNDGQEGDGTCTECEEGYWGENCASNQVDCQHGNPSLGISGNGKCASCDAGWDIASNCEKCDSDHYGDSCEKQYGTMTGRDGHVYKTMVVTDINGKSWIITAENIADQGDDVTCYANTDADPDFVKHYGCLYNWHDAQKVCPEGWVHGGREVPDVTFAGHGEINPNTGIVTYKGFGEHAGFWGTATVQTYWDKTGNARVYIHTESGVQDTYALKALSSFSVRCYQ